MTKFEAVVRVRDTYRGDWGDEDIKEILKNNLEEDAEVKVIEVMEVRRLEEDPDV